ncbi:MAG: AEC family transporter [Clostridiaceae bacterium]|nr:AEC family transporter [Clostridiaceae bacterium]
MTVLYLALVLFFLILIGFAARKLKIVDEGFAGNLSSFLFNIAYPALIIKSMQFPFTAESLITSFRLVVVSVLVLVISWCAAKFVNAALKADSATSGVTTFAIMYSNFTFMAFPVIEELYGEDMLFYLAIYTIVLRIAYCTHGVNAIAGPMKKKPGLNIKSVINPPVIAIPVGLALYFFSLRLPYPVARTIEMLSRIVSPLGMVVAGLILAELDFNEVFKGLRAYLISFIRLIVLPFIVFLIAKVLKLPDMERQIAVIVSAMPVASVAVIISAKYEANRELVDKATFVSTLFSIITVPLISLIV